MRRTFLARRNALLSRAQVTWGAAAVVFVLLCLAARTLAPNWFLSVVTPVTNAGTSISASIYNAAAPLTGSTTAALVQARNENTALAAKNRALTNKVETLAALLNATTTPSSALTPGVLVGVVARPPESPYGALTVAGGASAGVQQGMEAFGPGGVPVGVVTDVVTHFARVTLFSAPNEQLAGWLGPQNIPITIVGRGGGVLSAAVPRSAGASVGEVVYAPGPGALPVGSVAQIAQTPSSPTVTLRIVPAENPFSITQLIVRDTGSALPKALSCATTTPS